MEFFKTVWEWIMSENGGAIFAVLWLVSEALASFPAVQSNSVFQFIKNAIATVSGYLGKKLPKVER